MANSKFDNSLNRMSFLMEYNNHQYNTPKTNIEYHTIGADGKVYGILKEGSKYYIKTTEKGKENLSESYEYINGFNYRNENGFNSYNDATKHLEVKMMNLNESYGIHKDVSTVDFNRTKKSLTTLTEEARKELNRMNQIFENSGKIGMNNTGDPESKGKATAENTKKNNEPFSEMASASLDKDPKFNGTVKGATDNKDVNGVDSDLQSDKMKHGNSNSNKDYKDAHDDLDGEGVADKKPAGGKVVKMNESIDDYYANDHYFLEDDPNYFDKDDIVDTPMDQSDLDEPLDDTEEDYDPFEDMDSEDDTEEIPMDDSEPIDTDDTENLAGLDDEEDEDMDELLENFKSIITGPEKTLDGPHGGDGKDAEWERIDEDETQEAKQGNEETMKSYQKKGNMAPISWEHMNESVSRKVNRITENVCNQLFGKKTIKESLEEKIQRMVNEEVTRLDAWGKHPRFRKQPMQLPPNKEVMAGTADRDWNDDSTKGEQPYGKKIGSSAPFDKVVDVLTDSVLKKVNESLRLKKK